MSNYTSLLQPATLFNTLQALADKHSVATYVVGGFVRDHLLQKQCKDVDIVCVGDSLAVAKDFASMIPDAEIITFKKFSTSMVTWKDLSVEFVTARKESYTSQSRKPIVAAGTLEDDLLRRDFTINTLAIGLNTHNLGTLVDLYGGMEDLQAKHIRTPIDPIRTFSDDPLRMFRAVRFAVQLGFTLLPCMQKAIQQEAHRISILSKERIITELNKIILSPAPTEGLRLLDKVGLLSLVLPEMEKMKGVEVINGLSHKDNFIHTLQVVDNLAKSIKNKPHPRKIWLLWAAILHDIAKPITKRFDPRIGFTFHGHENVGEKMVPRLFRRLGLPMGADMRYVQKLVRLHLRHIPLIENKVTDAAIRRFLYDAGDELEDLILLCRADITSGNARKVATYLANFNRLAKKIALVEEKDRIRNLQPVIDGAIIMKTFQLSPCRQVGLIKEAVKEAILEGTIPNEYKAAHTYMLSYAKKIGLQPVSP